MADEKAVLMYKGRPLMRKDNLIYYGSMADSHIVMLQILETRQVNGIDVASRVSVQLQLTDPAAKSRDRIVKKSEKDGLYTADRIMRPGNRNARTNHISARQATVRIIKTQRIGWKKIASRPNTGSTAKNSISSS